MSLAVVCVSRPVFVSSWSWRLLSVLLRTVHRLAQEEGQEALVLADWRQTVLVYSRIQHVRGRCAGRAAAEVGEELALARSVRVERERCRAGAHAQRTHAACTHTLTQREFLIRCGPLDASRSCSALARLRLRSCRAFSSSALSKRTSCTPARPTNARNGRNEFRMPSLVWRRLATCHRWCLARRR